MAIAALLFVATVRVIDTRERARTVVRVMLATATVVAGIAVLEAAQVPAVMQALTLFRPGFPRRRRGSCVRPAPSSIRPSRRCISRWRSRFGLWLLSTCERVLAWVRPVVFVALVIVGAGITATFTRAGLIGMAAAIVVIAALAA